jgi:DNA-binding transcriptional ArsR family regulator
VSTEEFQTIIRNSVDQITRKCEIFSSPIRILVISIVLAQEEINWSQLKENLEKIIGGNLNPNTLSFHLNKLIEAGYLQKNGTADQPVYKVDPEHLSEIELNIGAALVDKIREKVLA